MKKAFVLFMILLAAIQSFAQSDSTGIPFVAYWSLGDTYDFKVTKVKQQWREDKMVKNDSSSYIANFEVIDSTASSYKIKWTYRNELFSNYNFSEELKRKLSNYGQTEIIYNTDELGIFIGVENWEEIAQLTSEIFDLVMEDVYEFEGKQKEEFITAMQQFKRSFQSKEGIESVILKELRTMHFPFGVEYYRNDTIRYQDELANLFGGDPIRGEVEITVEEVDIENEYCVLLQEMALNEEDSRSMLIDMFNMMNINKEEMEKVMKSAKIEITDYNKYAFFYYPGVPDFIETKRSSKIEGDGSKAKSVDKIRIELVFTE